MNIYMTRHAQTIYNKKRCYYGQLNPSLTQKGISQAKMLGKNIQENRLIFDKIYVSSQLRTYQTANIALKSSKLYYPQEIIQIEGLREREFGDWEGLTANQVMRKDPSNWEVFLKTPFLATPNNGETFEIFENRVIESFYEILHENKNDSQILVIGHLGALRVIISHILDSTKQFWDIEMDPTQLYLYKWPLEE